MATETLNASFDETTIANANTAVDLYIDAIAGAVGTLTHMEINLAASINSTDGGTGTYVYRLNLTANNETAALLKTALDGIWTEYEDVCTDSSLYSTIATVDGTVRITVTY